MKNIKGIAKIEFFDKKGKKVKEVNEENLITNSFQNLLNCANLICKNTLSNNASKNILMMSKLAKMENFIGGLLLFEDKINEDPNIFNHHKKSVASAGSKNDLSNPLKGSLNEQETGATNIEGKTAYRFVWDFGTANANCTFNTLCLSTKRAGDREIPLNKLYSSDFYSNAERHQNMLNARGNTITNSGQLVTVDGETNTIKKIEKRSNITIQDNLSSIFEVKTYNINGYTDFSSSHFYESGMLKFVAKKTLDNKLYFISVNPDTLEVTSEKELVGVTMGSYKTFSLVGDYMFYDYSANNSNLLLNFKVYNMKTNSTESNMSLKIAGDGYLRFDQNYFGGSYQRVFTYKRNGKYASYISSSFADSSSGDVFVADIIDKDIYEAYAKYSSSSGSLSARYISPMIGFDIDSNIALYSQSNDRNRYADHMVLFPNGHEPLFTINALANPVTKTEANTMKITYTLIYD